MTSRRANGRLGRLAAALVLAAGSAAVAAACSEDLEQVPPPPDGGEDSGTVGLSECPKVEPSNRAACLLPEGTTCEFGQCGTRLARCTRGAWMVASNPPPRPPCPEAPPNTDVPCPACWPREISCTYGSSDCSQADASLNTAIASCPQGSWVLDIRPCRDGGGPDVQRDGGPDED